MELDSLLLAIRSAAFEVRLHLSPGYLVSVYRNALIVELGNRGLKAEREVSIPVEYKGVIVGDFKADVLVEGRVILELKAVRELNPLHEAQLVNYLNATKIDYGFLINYGAEKFRIIRKTRLYEPKQ